MPEIYAIGDTHGCFLTVQKAITEIGILPEDTIVFLGDLVDRGPRIRQLLEFVDQRPNTEALQGNHDYHWADLVLNNEKAHNWSQGMLRFMVNTINQLGLDDLAITYAKKVQAWPFVIKEPSGKYIFCHASYNWREGEKFDPIDHIWQRWYAKDDDIRDSMAPFLAIQMANYNGPIIVHGHDPISMGTNPYHYIGDKLIGINLDGGCCYGKSDSCLRVLRVSDDRIWEIPNVD